MADLIQQHQPTEEPHVSEVERPFDSEDTRTIITRASPQRGPGPSGLRYRHLEALISPPLVDEIASFRMIVFSSDALAKLSRLLHAGGNLTALGEKARPVACINVLRRIIGATFLWQQRTSLEDLFEPIGQYGVGIQGVVELVTEKAMLSHQRGCMVLSSDGVTT